MTLKITMLKLVMRTKIINIDVGTGRKFMYLLHFWRCFLLRGLSSEIRK